MGRRGRQPLPVAVLKIRGSRYATPERAESEVIAPLGIPTRPDVLDGDAVAIAKWDEIVPLLAEAGTISPIDQMALTVLCRQWSQWVELFDADDERSRKLASRLSRSLLQLETQFGMTPASRLRLTRPEAKQPARAARFFS